MTVWVVYSEWQSSGDGAGVHAVYATEPAADAGEKEYVAGLIKDGFQVWGHEPEDDDDVDESDWDVSVYCQPYEVQN